MSPSVHAAFRWLRTVRHFPVRALLWRARLRLERKIYRPGKTPAGLPVQWNDFATAHSGWSPPVGVVLKALAGDAERAERLLAGEGVLLNETFRLYRKREELEQALTAHTPLWRENYGYLEFLLPLLGKPDPEKVDLLQQQVMLFWSLPQATRLWSTYGVSRRILSYCAMLPVLSRCSEAFRQAFWVHFTVEADYVARFLEWDLRGNHLTRNLTAWLAAVLVLEKLPGAPRQQAKGWWVNLSKQLPEVFEAQVLPDGFHYERTPMYHAWVLADLLDCLAWLKAEKPDYDRSRLEALAGRMQAVLADLRHSSGQLPLFGDTSLPQVPDLEGLLQERHNASPVPPGGEGLSPDAANVYEETAISTQVISGQTQLTFFENAGFAVFRHQQPQASLILDCGDFGPQALPAHSHCDMGSFELHIEDQPVIVDSGVSEYLPSLMRDYCRGTGAHNTVWLPGYEQAETWGGFRVAEYPSLLDRTVEQDESGAKVTLVYEDYGQHYEHQRSIYSVNGRFWVVQDWLRHVYPTDAQSFSLLHIHPDCRILYDNEIFRVGERLLVVPFGASKIEWSNHSPWRNNLNLYSPGFSLAQPGQLIAITPKLPDCFGWVLIPHSGQLPECEKRGESLMIHDPGHGEYQMTWDSEGLKVAFSG